MKKDAQPVVLEPLEAGTAALDALHAEVDSLRRPVGGAGGVVGKDLRAPGARLETEGADLLDVIGRSVQKEIRIALDAADEMPEGRIFIIPLRLEPCRVPDRLAHLQWFDYFGKGGLGRL